MAFQPLCWIIWRQDDLRVRPEINHCPIASSWFDQRRWSFNSWFSSKSFVGPKRQNQEVWLPDKPSSFFLPRHRVLRGKLRWGQGGGKELEENWGVDHQETNEASKPSNPLYPPRQGLPFSNLLSNHFWGGEKKGIYKEKRGWKTDKEASKIEPQGVTSAPGYII